MTDTATLLQMARIPWSRFSEAQVVAIALEALLHGDAVLARRARAALARRAREVSRA